MHTWYDIMFRLLSCNTLYTMYNVKRTTYIVRRTTYNVHCTTYNVHCTMYTSLRTSYYMHRRQSLRTQHSWSPPTSGPLPRHAFVKTLVLSRHSLYIQALVASVTWFHLYTWEKANTFFLKFRIPFPIMILNIYCLYIHILYTYIIYKYHCISLYIAVRTQYVLCVCV